MTIDLAGIHNRQVPQDQSTKDRLVKDANFYGIIARKLISSISPRFKTGLAQEILANEDAIENITTEIMFADWKWNGGGTIEGYRKQCAIWAIQGYMSRAIKRPYNVSLNNTVNSGDGKDVEFQDLIPDSGAINPEEMCNEAEQTRKRHELINSLLDSNVLTPQQNKCIRMYFLQEMSLQAIAKELYISREAVRQLVFRGLNRLRNLNNDKEE
jgi:RNA polymerase sigma factor (sigma-70 family)